MSNTDDSLLYIPLCGNSACETKLKFVADFVTKCTTTHPMYGKFSTWFEFENHFKNNRFTIIHLCPDLWQKVQCCEKDLESFDEKVISLNLNFEDVKEVASNSNPNDLESANKFFRKFSSQHHVSNDKELLQFAENIKSFLSEEDERAPQEDEGYCIIDYTPADYSERVTVNVFKKYPDIFGKTEQQHVFVKNCHIFDISPNVPIYVPGKSSDTGDNIEKLNRDCTPDMVLFNNKYILLQTLPDIYHKKDLPALASVCMCRDIVIQKRALVLLELCLWEGTTEDPEKYLSYLFTVERMLDVVLTNLQKSYGNTRDTVYRALFERASNVYIVILSAIIMCSKSTQEMAVKCGKYLETIRNRTRSRMAGQVSKLHQFVTTTKDFLKAKDESVSIIGKITLKDKNTHKCARKLSSKHLIDQSVVIFEVLKKVFEPNADVNFLSFLLDYLTPHKGFRKTEPDLVCIIMVFRALTLFLKYHLLHFLHSDVKDLYQKVINILFVASDRDLPAEVARSLHSLLFHPNSGVRAGIFKMLDERKKYKASHVQYLRNEILGVMDPLLNLYNRSQVVTKDQNLIKFKDSKWTTLSGKFGTENVVLYFLVMTEVDFRQDIRVTLENHKDINYNEMYHLIRVQHRNIIQLFAYQRFQAPLFYILEDCSQTLQTVMQNYRNNGKYFTHLELCGFLLDAVTALLYCHNKNLIHRNLTAESLTYSHNKVVKLCSFGLCVDPDLTMSQKFIDFDDQKNIPFRWSAPESIFDCEYSKQSDIWMVGVLIYEVMTHGVLPFSNLKVSGRALGEKMRKQSVHLNSEICLDDGMFQLIADCTTYHPDSRPYIENVKTVIERVIQVCSQNPRTIDQFPYPKFDKEGRQPSAPFIRGLPFLLRPSTVENEMGDIGHKSLDKFNVSDILLRIKQKNGLFVFCEEVIHNMPPTMLSLLLSDDLKVILTQTIKFFQSRDSVQYIVTSIPPSSCFLSQILDGELTNLQTVVEVIFQVAVKLSRIASLNLVLGDLYPSAVYLDNKNDRNVYIMSLAFMKRPIEDEYQAYNDNQPDIPDFMTPRAAPELIQENNFSPKSDVYCFGCFMWETLTAFDVSKNSAYVNSVPSLFSNMSFHEIKSAVMKNEWEAHNPCPQCCPDRIYQLIKSCVSSLKTERPTMRHVVMKLKEYYRELFNATLEEFDPDNSPRENVFATSSGTSTVDSLTKVNPSSDGSSLSDSDWGSMFSFIVSLEEINPSLCSTTVDSEEVYGFANKYVDVDSHPTSSMDIPVRGKKVDTTEGYLSPVMLGATNDFPFTDEDIYEMYGLSPNLHEQETDIYSLTPDISPAGLDKSQSTSDGADASQAQSPAVPQIPVPDKPPLPMKLAISLGNALHGKTPTGTSLENEKKSMDDKNIDEGILEKAGFGTNECDSAIKSNAVPFVSGRKLRDILINMDNKRAASRRGKTEETGVGTDSLPLSTSGEDSEEQRERDHQSALEKTMSRVVRGTHHGDKHGRFKNCESKRHNEFKNVDEIDKNPTDILEIKEDEPRLRKLIDRTARVVVSYTSIKRPDTDINWKKPYPSIKYRGYYNMKRYGTGFLHERYNYEVTKPCSCPECKTTTCQESNRKSHYFVVRTATHVIFDKHEAQNAVFEFGYDSDDREKVKAIYGVTVIGSKLLRLETEKCFVVCVTHDSILAKKLNSLISEIEATKSWFVVSHPHGECKRISVDHTPDLDPCGVFVIKLDKKSINLKTDMEIRLVGRTRDDECVQRDIQSLLNGNTIVKDCAHDEYTYRLTSDMTVHYPDGIIMDTDRRTFLDLYPDEKKNNDDNVKEENEDKEAKIWFRLKPGPQLVTDDGRDYTFSNKNDEDFEVCIAVFGNIKSLLGNIDKDQLKFFLSSEYKLATCPGTSGAHVDLLGNLHYGISDAFGHGISTWTCVYEPKHFKEDPKTIEGNDCPFSLRDLVEYLLKQNIGFTDDKRQCQDVVSTKVV